MMNGTKHYVTEVFIDSVSFTGEPKPGVNTSANNAKSNSNQQPNNYSEQPNSAIVIGNISDFEEILSDNGVPF